MRAYVCGDLSDGTLKRNTFLFFLVFRGAFGLAKKNHFKSFVSENHDAVNFRHYVCGCTGHQTSKLVKNRLECKAEESSARPRGLCDALRDRVRSRKPALRCRLRFNRVTFVGDLKSTPLDEHFNRARRPSRVHFCCTASVFRAFARFLFREMFSRSFVEHANNEAFSLSKESCNERLVRENREKKKEGFPASTFWTFPNDARVSAALATIN